MMIRLACVIVFFILSSKSHGVTSQDFLIRFFRRDRWHQPRRQGRGCSESQGVAGGDPEHPQGGQGGRGGPAGDAGVLEPQGET